MAPVSPVAVSTPDALVEAAAGVMPGIADAASATAPSKRTFGVAHGYSGEEMPGAALGML